MKKIMLCCNAGMSTSLLVQKMQSQVASPRVWDIEVEARPMNRPTITSDECDILLLGPQIGYTKGRF